MEGVLCVEVLSSIVWGHCMIGSVDIRIGRVEVHLDCGWYECDSYGEVAVT